MKLDAEEKELLESVERGEWKPAGGGKRERTRYARYAKATFRKDRRLNIRLSSKDLEAIQKRALAEGLPYQTLRGSFAGDLTVRIAAEHSGPRVWVDRVILYQRKAVDRQHAIVLLQGSTGSYPS